MADATKIQTAAVKRSVAGVGKSRAAGFVRFFDRFLTGLDRDGVAA
jgi:hypothetical protein